MKMELQNDDEQKERNEKSLRTETVDKLKSNNNKLVSCQKFIKLKKDTDLNKINENLFWKSSLFNYFNKWTHNKRSHDLFASIKMANMYVNDGLLADIDVISNAENIKELLKMPFDKHKQVSLMIHRIGKTLLIDEFDIHSHLLKIEKNFIRQNKSRKALTDRDLLLKFLCSSLPNDLNTSTTEYPIFKVSEPSQETSTQNNENSTTTNQNDDRSNVFWTFENIKMLIGSNLPIFGDENRPAITLRLRDMRKPISILTGLDYWLDNLICNIPELHMCYHIDGIVQNYEVIKTEDIPYLNGSEFPPNVVKTIAKNILSFLKSNVTKEGHTYWLFKGPDDEIVKLYDLTSLCDNFINDKYDNAYTVPVAMLLYRVANNMIHQNLNDNINELKNIYTLLRKSIEMLDKNRHPEVYCSACYLVTNLFIRDTCELDDYGKRIDSKVQLNKSSHKTTSDNDYNESTLELGSLKIKNSEEQRKQHKLNNNNHDNDNYDEQDNSFTNELIGDEKLNEEFRNLLNNQLRQAYFSIEYLAYGLQALELNEKKAFESSERSEYIKDPDNFNKPDRVIPLAFYKISSTQLNTTKTAQSTKNITVQSLFNRNKALLIQKALISFYYLANNARKLLKYGDAFKYIRIASICLIARKKLWSFDENIELNRLLINLIKLAGDIRILMINELKNSSNRIETENTYLNEYNNLNEFESFFIQKSQEIIRNTDNNFLIDYYDELMYLTNDNFNLKNNEENYLLALKSYEFTLKYRQMSKEEIERDEEVILKKRYANAKNELGTYYLNECSNLIRYEEENIDLFKKIELYLQKSYICFNDGIKSFESIKDMSNCALLTANCAKLMRFYSKFFTETCFNKLNLNMESFRSSSITKTKKDDELLLFKYFTNETFNQMSSFELFSKEKQFLLKAIDLYIKALTYVQQPVTVDNDILIIINSLYWDLSTTCFNLACLIQDYAPNTLVDISYDDIEKEITDYMNKSISYLKQIKKNSTQNDIEYRLAVIHHRLASLYHHSFRKQSTLSETKKKHLKSLADTHYDKAVNYYNLNNYSCERFRVLLEEIALIEFQYDNSTGNNFKIKLLENSFKLFDKCKECLVAITSIIIPQSNIINDDLVAESNKLTKIFIQRIQYILKNLIKCYSLKKKQSNEDQIQTNKLKTQYLKSISQFDLSKYTDASNSHLKTRIYNDLINFLNNLDYKES